MKKNVFACILQLLLVRIECPRYHEERENIMNSTEVLEELESYQYLYHYLSDHTGMPVRDPDDVQSIYSTLKAEVYDWFYIQFYYIGICDKDI